MRAIKNIKTAENGRVIHASKNGGDYLITFKDSDYQSHYVELHSTPLGYEAYEDGNKLLLGVADVLVGKLNAYLSKC